MTTQPAPEARLALVALPGEIDVTNALDIYDQITAAALRPEVTIVVADMTATTFCDGMGLRILLLAHACDQPHAALTSPPARDRS
jgi:anti-anti-sigma factor